MSHPAQPSDPDLRRGTLPRGPFGYTDEGEGPVIVAVHGVPGSVRDFRWFAPALTDRFRVVRLDLPGYGGTPSATWPGYAPEDRAAFVLAAMRALGIARATLAGHSLGGIVSVAAADLAPKRVEAVVLLASPGFTAHRGFRRVPRAALSKWLASPRRAQLSEPVARRFFALAGFRGPYPYTALVDALHTAAAARIDQHARRLAQLAHPTAVVWCEDDPLIEPEIPARLAASLPAGPRLRFETGGHNPQKFFANEIAEALGAWLLADP